MTYTKQIATSLQISESSVQSVISLLDDGNTIPFISRYRKEATGGLDEVQLRGIKEELNRLRLLNERKETIRKSILGQGKMTPDLEGKINAAGTRSILEDIYQPFKPKRKTRASVARGAGLQELADLILQQIKTEKSLKEIAQPYLSDQVSTVDEAWQGARDIAAETISEQTQIRQALRKKALQTSHLTTRKKKRRERMIDRSIGTITNLQRK